MMECQTQRRIRGFSSITRVHSSVANIFFFSSSAQPPKWRWCWSKKKKAKQSNTIQNFLEIRVFGKNEKWQTRCDERAHFVASVRPVVVAVQKTHTPYGVEWTSNTTTKNRNKIKRINYQFRLFFAWRTAIPFCCVALLCAIARNFHERPQFIGQFWMYGNEYFLSSLFVCTFFAYGMRLRRRRKKATEAFSIQKAAKWTKVKIGNINLWWLSHQRPLILRVLSAPSVCRTCRASLAWE